MEKKTTNVTCDSDKTPKKSCPKRTNWQKRHKARKQKIPHHRQTLSKPLLPFPSYHREHPAQEFFHVPPQPYYATQEYGYGHMTCSSDIFPMNVGYPQGTRIIPCSPEEFMWVQNQYKKNLANHQAITLHQRAAQLFEESSSLDNCVIATTVNGTTFYHNNNMKIEPSPNNNIGESFSDDCKRPMALSSEVCLDAVKRSQAEYSSQQQRTSCQTTSHSLQQGVSFSYSTSRSSSPFVLTNDTASLSRDSGLLSMESTDEEFSSGLGLQQADSNDEIIDPKLQLIMQTAEEVLTDESDSKNTYIIRQMNRNPNGYVSIRLLASDKKVKMVTKNYNALVLALRHSKKLSLNSQSTKVKVNNPAVIHSSHSKTPAPLIIIDPTTNFTMEALMKRFQKYGTITQMRILQPDLPLPNYLKGYSSVIPQLGKVTCGIVEFDQASSTYAALKDVCGRHDGVTAAVLGHKLKRSLLRNSESSKTDQKNCNSPCSGDESLINKEENVKAEHLPHKSHDMEVAKADNETSQGCIQDSRSHVADPSLLCNLLTKIKLDT